MIGFLLDQGWEMCVRVPVFVEKELYLSFESWFLWKVLSGFGFGIFLVKGFYLGFGQTTQWTDSGFGFHFFFFNSTSLKLFCWIDLQTLSRSFLREKKINFANAFIDVDLVIMNKLGWIWFSSFWVVAFGCQERAGFN